MTQKFADGARTELAASIGAGDTTFTLVDGARFPNAAMAGEGSFFYAVLQDDTGFEIVTVNTHAAGSTPDTFSDVLRGQYGTTARAFAAGSVVGLRPLAADMYTAINERQPVLVSGTNIKTVGGQSLLGSGDVPLGDFLYGAPDPDNGGGSDGDVYIQSDGKLWKKGSGVWTYTGIQFAAQAAAMLLTGAQSASGVKTFTNRSVHAGAYTPSLTPAHSATPTFDCATGNVFEPAALTGNVTSITLSNAVAGQTVQIRFQQDATGGRTVAVPSGAKVDGNINTGANRVSWLILTYSSRGARWEGNWLQIPN